MANSVQIPVSTVKKMWGWSMKLKTMYGSGILFITSILSIYRE